MSLAARLDALKIGGNASFKEGMWQEALDGYKQGVDEARAARAEDTVPDALATLYANRAAATLYANRAAATLYANRAAAALKLDLYEQAIHDTSQAMRLLLKPGASELAPAVTNSALFIKCAVRRAGALKAVGNLAAAQVDLMFAGKDRGSQPALAEARQLWSTHGFPTLWGTGHLPLLPSKRSSVAVEWADIQLCKAALPATSLFSTAVVYEGRVYVLGGRTVEFPMNRNMPMNINVFDPEKDTISQCVVAPDPKHGAPRPRTGHSAVLLGSVLITYGGDWTDFRPSYEDVAISEAEGRLVWKVDLAQAPLQWQRIRARKGDACPAFSREGHTAVLHGHTMVVYGGRALASIARAADELGDVWGFDLLKERWSLLAPEPKPRRLGEEPLAPEARKMHVAWTDANGEFMYVFGGSRAPPSDRNGQIDFTVQDGTFPDMWKLSLRERRWQRVYTTCSAPCGRSEACVAVGPNGREVALCGGYTTNVTFQMNGQTFGSAYLNDVWIFNSRTERWQMARTADLQGALGPLRAGAVAAWLDKQLYVGGGYIGLNICKGKRDFRAIRLKSCSSCGAWERKLLRCAACKAKERAPAYYCSTACLEADWPVHKTVCAERGVLP